MIYWEICFYWDTVSLIYLFGTQFMNTNVVEKTCEEDFVWVFLLFYNNFCLLFLAYVELQLVLTDYLNL